MTGPAGRIAGVLAAALVLFTVIAMPATIPSAVADQAGGAPFLLVRIDRVTPEVVTTASDPTVTVTGTVLNVGDRPVRDVIVRLEHAPGVKSSSGISTDLDGANDQFQAVGEFIDVASDMQQGQSAPFVLSYPLRSATDPSLGIEQPGVYPVLVNVNGTPDYGAPARLDDARFLLPVVGVPADPTATASADTVTAVVPPDTSKPVRVTMLWPLADRPRLAAGAPGATAPVRLVDDDLATSLATGGRLDTLLDAADFATGPEVDPQGLVRSAMCLAVDPDLLVTVNAMAGGYVVDDTPDGGPGSPTHPGAGQQAAAAWLTRLKALAQRMCVAPTPYAQADLDALQRIGDAGLSALATNSAGDIVNQILGITCTRGATLVGDGQLTGPAVAMLSAQGPTVAIAAAADSDGDPAADDVAADLTPVRNTPQVVFAPFDAAVGAALAGAGTDPAAPSYLDPALDLPLQHDSPTARRMDAVASMLLRDLRPDTEPRTEILAPPMEWNLQSDDARAILSALATSIHAGLTVPHPLSALIAEGDAIPAEQQQPVPEPVTGDPHARIDDAVTSGVAAQTGRLWALTAAMTTDVRTNLTGTAYTAPLREDMLRALSQAVPAEDRNGLAEQRLADVQSTVDDLFGAVTIVNPGGSYTLATERSPLPLALRNDLPVPIRVRLQVNAPPGMIVTDPGEIELPPGYLPIKVPIEVHFTQRVAVDVALMTPDGLALGEPVRLSVHSNAYGKVLFLITLAAGAVLVLLAGRRLWHRFRGQPDPADLDRPRSRSATPPEPSRTASDIERGR